MRIEHLEYLVEAARCRSMRQAAHNLFCTQPAISGAISSIEKELGFPVLERTPSGVIPTSKGGMIIDDAAQILRLVHGWTLMHTEKENRDVAGEIYAADSGEFGLTFFQGVAMRIDEKYPRIVMHLVDPGNILQRINTGAFQIAVLPILPIHFDAMKSYMKRYHWEMEPLYDASYTLLVNTKHPLAKRFEVTVQDLKRENIRVQASFPYRDSLEAIESSSDIRFENSIKILSAVSENLAVGIFPDSHDAMVEEFEKAGLIKSVPFLGGIFPMRYCLLYWERLPFLEAGIAVIREMRDAYRF